MNAEKATTGTPVEPIVMRCVDCKFYRAKTKRHPIAFSKTNLVTPTEYEDRPTGHGECMLLPPSVAFRQAAVDRNETWAGPVASVVEPGFAQRRPIVSDDEFCGQYSQKDDA